MTKDQQLKISENSRSHPFRVCVEDAVGDYLDQLKGERVRNLYKFVLSEMEQPLLETVMKRVDGNQSQASMILGISRSTLRKKLAAYNLD